MMSELDITGRIKTSPVEVKVINKSMNMLPQYETEQAAGMDVRADISPNIMMVLAPGQSVMVKTGLFVEIPRGYEIQVRPRSGLAYKNQITVLNSPGTIDSDYRGEIGVILINHGTKSFEIQNGDRIGQLVLAKHERIQWTGTVTLGQTDRGEGGLGSTGKK